MGQIQGTDSLFKPSDLVYFSALERESFTRYFEGQPDYLKMIAAININTDEGELELYRDWINEIILNIRQKKFDRLSEKKKIDQIRKSLTQALLVSYEHQSSFGDLFGFAKYNYFTAASIYAFILDEFNIPYEIHEVFTHIYLLAYPQDLQITIEITGPGNLYFMLNHETRSDFVDFLRRTNVVDDATFTGTTSRVIFERYYFNGYGFKIRELIGMLYLNSAVDYMNNSDLVNAYYQFEKAFILHPSYKTQYLLLAQLNGFLSSMDYHNPLDLGYLIKASRLIGFGIERELIVEYLQDMIHKVLIEEQDEKGIQYIYEYIQEYLGDEALIKEFNFLFHYETGRMHFIDAQYSIAMESFETAYALKPDNENNQDLLVRALGGYSSTASAGMVLEKLNKYDTSCSEIIANEIYLSVKLQTCLEIAGEAFQLQDRKNGEHYLAIFEDIVDRYPETFIDYILVGRSYSSASIYYYRKGQVQKSREIVHKGLSYAPQNIELKLKLKAFE